MAKHARSARGQVVDFDLLAIKQQLATQPITVGVKQRRKFIDERDGVKLKDQENYIIGPTPPAGMPDALKQAAQAAAESAAAAKTEKK